MNDQVSDNETMREGEACWDTRYTDTENHKKAERSTCAERAECEQGVRSVRERQIKEANVPLVGCFANDTENRFTAGIDKSSEEIKTDHLS